LRDVGGHAVVPERDPLVVVGRYDSAVLDAASRRRNQPAPPAGIREARTELNRSPSGAWLSLREDQQPPEVKVDQPDLVIWSSIWASCPDARVRLDLAAEGEGTALRWTLLVDPPVPEPALLRHMGKGLNQLINADLRYTFVQ
jgi:hypothetical protein